MRLQVVLFPEFTQVFAAPCGQGALAVLKAYPHAQAVAQAGVEAVYQVLRGVPSAHFGRPTAKKLVLAAQASGSSSRVLSGRESLLYILCDQLEHTQAKRTAAGRAVGTVDQHRSANQGLAADTRTGAKVGGGPAC